MNSKDKYSRREILEAGTIAFSSSCLSPIIDLKKLTSISQKHLVLIHLKGGNDALNTVVPYNNSHYYKNRQNLAIDKNSVLKLDNNYGLHPSLNELVSIFNSGDLALVLGVGYPNASMSHELSTNVWNSGELEGSESKQWFDTNQDKNNISVRNYSTFNSFQNELKFSSGSGLQVSKIEIEGYDTHSTQLDVHSIKLKQLAKGLGKIYESNSRRDTLTLVYSEFGRSITPNEDGGTDHGDGGLLMLMGSNIHGGIYGDYGDLTNCSDCISASIDFRRVQKSLASNWIDYPESLMFASRKTANRFNPLIG